MGRYCNVDHLHCRHPSRVLLYLSSKDTLKDPRFEVDSSYAATVHSLVGITSAELCWNLLAQRGVENQVDNLDSAMLSCIWFSSLEVCLEIASWSIHAQPTSWKLLRAFLDHIQDSDNFNLD